MVDPPYKDVALKVWRVSKKVEGVTKKVGGSGHPDPPVVAPLDTRNVQLLQFHTLIHRRRLSTV